FSWTHETVNKSSFGAVQTAYQIIVSSSLAKLKDNNGDVWNSNWIQSSNMQLINYAGKPLVSDKTYFWKVRVKDEKGRISVWSKVAQWSTGLLQSADWKAKWIGTDQIFDPTVADCNIWDPWLRKRFSINKKPDRAVFFLASVGFHELYVNGQKVTDDVLSPAVTDHVKRARYVAYDIAPLLTKGENVIAIWLGTSWSIFGPYIDKSRPNTPIVIAQGNVGGQLIKTDESWLTHKSPNKLLGTWDFGKMGGELYDANKNITDWNLLNTDESIWQPAVVYQPDLILSAQQVEPNKVFDEIKPVAIVARPDGTYRVDMGVNFAGWTSVNVAGNQGDKIESWEQLQFVI
ncbi:MAG: alpha-L-rhamnosidase, partial [Pedobacter sp.]